jgi:hypothetical protein
MRCVGLYSEQSWRWLSQAKTQPDLSDCRESDRIALTRRREPQVALNRLFRILAKYCFDIRDRKLVHPQSEMVDRREDLTDGPIRIAGRLGLKVLELHIWPSSDAAYLTTAIVATQDRWRTFRRRDIIRRTFSNPDLVDCLQESMGT